MGAIGWPKMLSLELQAEPTGPSKFHLTSATSAWPRWRPDELSTAGHGDDITTLTNPYSGIAIS